MSAKTGEVVIAPEGERCDGGRCGCDAGDMRVCDAMVNTGKLLYTPPTLSHPLSLGGGWSSQISLNRLKSLDFDLPHKRLKSFRLKASSDSINVLTPDSQFSGSDVTEAL